MNLSLQIFTDDDSFSLALVVTQDKDTNNFNYDVPSLNKGGVIYNHEGTPLELVQKVLTSVIGK